MARGIEIWCFFGDWSWGRNLMFLLGWMSISFLLAWFSITVGSGSVLGFSFLNFLQFGFFLNRWSAWDFLMVIFYLTAFAFARLVSSISILELLLGISSSSSLVFGAFPFGMLRCQFGWVFSDKLDVIVNWNSLILFDVDEKLLGMWSDLSTRSRTYELLNSLPIFSVISQTCIIIEKY